MGKLMFSSSQIKQIIKIFFTIAAIGALVTIIGVIKLFHQHGEESILIGFILTSLGHVVV
jgi:hypothetical protein